VAPGRCKRVADGLTLVENSQKMGLTLVTRAAFGYHLNPMRSINLRTEQTRFEGFVLDLETGMAETDDPFASVSGQPAYAMPGMRVGLRRGATTGAALNLRTEMIDTKTGTAYSLTAAEVFLVEAADGKTDLNRLHENQLLALESPLSPSDVLAFFRRLKLLGLLANSPDQIHGATSDPMQRQRPGPFGRSDAPEIKADVVARISPQQATLKRMAENRLLAEAQALKAATPAAEEPAAVDVPEQVAKTRRKVALAKTAADGKSPQQATLKRMAENRLLAEVQALKAATPAAEEPAAVDVPEQAAKTRRKVALAKTAADGKSPQQATLERMAENRLLAEAQALKAATPAAEEPAAVDVPEQASPTPNQEAKSRRRAAVAKAVAHRRSKEQTIRADTESRLDPDEGEPKSLPIVDEVDLSAPNKRAPRRQKSKPIPPAPPEKTDADLGDILALRDLQGVDEAKPDPLEVITATLSTVPVDPYAMPSADMNDLDDEFGAMIMPPPPRDDAGGRFAGRLGGGMAGGFGGGMGGGGMGGGGMGGGGMGGPNAERIMAMLAARRAGGGGRAGAGAEPDSAHGEQRPMGVALLNPTWLLRLLYVLFFPLRYFGWLTIPVVIFAGMTVVQNWTAFVDEFVIFQGSASIIIRVLASLITVNLASRLVQGCAIIAYGGQVRTMGIALDFGFFPRFFVDISSIPSLSRQGQLWAWGAPILARYWLFGLGVVLWAVTRNSGTWLSHYAIMVAQFGLLMAVRSSLPVFPGDGQRFLSTFFNDSRLLSKSILALRHVFTGRALPASIPRSDIVPLAAFGAAVVLSSVGAFLVVAVIVATQLETNLGGFGVTIFLSLAGLSLFYFLVLNTAIRRRVEALGGGGGMQGGLAQELLAGQKDAELGDTSEEGKRGGAARVFWAVVALGLLAVAFLPYDYDSGGAVDVLPASRAQAVARTDGEILEVLVDEGEIVLQDQVLAKISSWEQENAVQATGAQLAGAQAQLNKLLAGAKAEEIDLAMKQVESARSSLALSQAELDRATSLLASGTITQRAFDSANSTYQQDIANLAVSEARLELVRSGSTPEEIAIAQSDVDRLATELSYRKDELERTSIRAPMEGRVVTPNLDLLRGRYLRTGEILIEIERVEVIKASIAVPEADIGLIKVGAEVRLKAWGDSDREILGVVESVSSAAIEQTSGSVVRVLASFDNSDGLLRSNMTGYAKIDGGEMTVWRAYLRSLTRFFQIEVWSWIP
jgi:multidrug resistance efflux pump